MKQRRHPHQSRWAVHTAACEPCNQGQSLSADKRLKGKQLQMAMHHPVLVKCQTQIQQYFGAWLCKPQLLRQEVGESQEHSLQTQAPCHSTHAHIFPAYPPNIRSFHDGASCQRSCQKFSVCHMRTIRRHVLAATDLHCIARDCVARHSAFLSHKNTTMTSCWHGSSPRPWSRAHASLMHTWMQP